MDEVKITVKPVSPGHWAITYTVDGEATTFRALVRRGWDPEALKALTAKALAEARGKAKET